MDDNLRERFRPVSRTSRHRSRPVETSRPRPSTQPLKQPERNKPPQNHSRNYRPNFEPPQKKKSKKSRSRILLIVCAMVLLVSVTSLVFLKIRNSSNKSKTVAKVGVSQQKSDQDSSQPQIIRLVATGDMIAHKSVLENGKKADGNYDFSQMMKNMEPYFKKATVSFCNQATPVGGPQFGYTGYPIFTAPVEWSRAIEGVGCNVVNIGTNHTNDKGQPLIDATVAAWDGRQNMLAVVGANRSTEEQAKIRYFEKGGVKFAILSYTTYTNNKEATPYGINMYDSTTSVNQIKEARKNADIVLVSMRWGTEYSADINPEQEKVAQEVANAGADVIIGHGPHFLQPTKIVKRANGNNTFVWFSLGNFLNTQIETEALISGFAIMDIDTKTKVISAPMFLPTYMHYEWTAAEKKANNLSARKNLQMYVLDQAAEPMSRSQIGTTVEAQTDRVTKLLNTYTPVKIIKSSEY